MAIATFKFWRFNVFVYDQMYVKYFKIIAVLQRCPRLKKTFISVQISAKNRIISILMFFK